MSKLTVPLATDPAAEGASTARSTGLDVRERALVLWPRLDRARLRRTHGDPARIARLVASRSSLPPETIIALLVQPPRERGLGRVGVAAS